MPPRHRRYCQKRQTRDFVTGGDSGQATWLSQRPYVDNYCLPYQEEAEGSRRKQKETEGNSTNDTPCREQGGAQRPLDDTVDNYCLTGKKQKETEPMTRDFSRAQADFDCLTVAIAIRYSCAGLP